MSGNQGGLINMPLFARLQSPCSLQDLESLYSLQNDIDSNPSRVLEALKDGV